MVAPSRPSVNTRPAGQPGQVWKMGCLGAVLGILVATIGLLIIALLLSTRSSLAVAEDDPSQPDVTITIQEAYLKKVLAQPLPVGQAIDLQVDLQPGNRIAFQGRVQVPLLGQRLEGDVSATLVLGVAHDDGQLTVKVQDVRLAGFALDRGGDLFVNELPNQIIQMIMDRVVAQAGQKPKIMSISTDDHQLTLRADALMNDRTIALGFGLLAGMLVCCLLGGVLMAASSPRTATEEVEPPSNALIEVEIAEQYLDRSFLDYAADVPSPWPIVDGQLDLRPGGQIRFVAVVDSPLGELTVYGTVTLAVHDGQIQIRLPDVRLGGLPVAPLMRAFQPDMEDQINQKANKLLLAGTSAAKLTLVGIRTNDSQLWVYLTAK